MPPWLPGLIDINGQWDETVRRLYAVFDRDIVAGRPRFRGQPVWHDRRLLDDARPEGFWHLITKDDRDTGERLLDPRRAERIGWCGAIIANSADPAITVSDYREGNGRIRTYLWLRDSDYVVILERVVRRGRVVAHLLVTSYYLDGSSGRRSMERRLAQRLP